jgi:hypothetical protein
MAKLFRSLVLRESETPMRHAAGPPIGLKLNLDPALHVSKVDRAQLEAAVSIWL